MGGEGGVISLKINSDSPSRTPGAGLAPLGDALEPGESVRPRPGASHSPEEVGGLRPRRGCRGASLPRRSHDSGRPFPPRGAGARSPPSPRGVPPPRSAASVPFGTPRERGAGLPLHLHLPAEGPLRVEWGGAAAPQAFPPPPLTLRPAPRPALAPPAGPRQPQPRRRQVYLSLRSPESPGRSGRRHLSVSMVLSLLLPPAPLLVLPHPGPETAMRARPGPAPARCARTPRGGSSSVGLPPSADLPSL